MAVSFELDGQEFVALNGGPEYTFSEAVSFQIACETQDEVDAFWSGLSQGGQEGPCGWLKDRYGVSWQIIPTVLPELLGSRAGEVSARDAGHDGHDQAGHRRPEASAPGRVRPTAAPGRMPVVPPSVVIPPR